MLVVHVRIILLHLLFTIHQVWNQLGNLGYDCNFELIPDEIEGFLERPTSTSTPTANSSVNQDSSVIDGTTAATAGAAAANAVSADAPVSTNTSDNSAGATHDAVAAVDDAMDTVEVSETEPSTSTITRCKLRIHLLLCNCTLL
jgi:hypothetical protein